MPFTDSTEPVPARLETEEFVLRPIVVGDAEMDYAAVMETREQLRLWRQSTWPEDDFTVEANRKDLIDLEERHAAIARSRIRCSTQTEPAAWAACTSFPPARSSSRTAR